MKRFLISKKVVPNTVRILYRSAMDMIFFGFVTGYIRNVKFNYSEAFREFRDAFDVEYDQYTNARCYHLMGAMSKEHKEFCQTELKNIKAEKAKQI